MTNIILSLCIIPLSVRVSFSVVNLSNISIGGKNYPQKIQEKYIIKRNIKFHLIKSNQKLKLKSEEKQKGILRTGKKVISNNCWINLPLTIEKYIKNRVINLKKMILIII